MRADHRAPDQLRPVKLTPNFIAHAEGSVLIEMGGTRSCPFLTALAKTPERDIK